MVGKSFCIKGGKKRKSGFLTCFLLSDSCWIKKEEKNVTSLILDRKPKCKNVEVREAAVGMR